MDSLYHGRVVHQLLNLFLHNFCFIHYIHVLLYILNPFLLIVHEDVHWS